MARTKWKQVNPQLYDLNDIATSVERCTSLELETGLRVQVLRIKPSNVAEPTVKDALEQSEVWAKALVTSTDRFVYVALFHEE